MRKRTNAKLLNFEMLDSCLADSFESIVKVGLYIIFFSILIALPGKLSAGHPLLAAILPALEMTNGILMIHQAAPDLTVSYPLILGLTSFGGFCSAAQTQCMLKGCFSSDSALYHTKTDCRSGSQSVRHCIYACILKGVLASC